MQTINEFCLSMSLIKFQIDFLLDAVGRKDPCCFSAIYDSAKRNNMFQISCIEQGRIAQNENDHCNLSEVSEDIHDK